MTDHSEQTPDFPNGSIDLNALHDAARAGTLAGAMPESAILIGEVEISGVTPTATAASAPTPPPTFSSFASQRAIPSTDVA